MSWGGDDKAGTVGRGTDVPGGNHSLRSTPCDFATRLDLVLWSPPHVTGRSSEQEYRSLTANWNSLKASPGQFSSYVAEVKSRDIAERTTQPKCQKEKTASNECCSSYSTWKKKSGLPEREVFRPMWMTKGLSRASCVSQAPSHRRLQSRPGLNRVSHLRGQTDMSARFHTEGPQVRTAGVLVFVPRGSAAQRSPLHLRWTRVKENKAVVFESAPSLSCLVRHY